MIKPPLPNHLAWQGERLGISHSWGASLEVFSYRYITTVECSGCLNAFIKANVFLDLFRFCIITIFEEYASLCETWSQNTQKSKLYLNIKSCFIFWFSIYSVAGIPMEISLVTITIVCAIYTSLVSLICVYCIVHFLTKYFNHTSANLEV